MAKPLVFLRHDDAYPPLIPSAHLMDLRGPRSIEISGTSPLAGESRQWSIGSILPLVNDLESRFHGYYIVAGYQSSLAKNIDGEPWTPSTGSWQVGLGRANVNMGWSIFRGFLQLNYRDLKVRSDTSTNQIKSRLGFLNSEIEKKSFILSMGASSTQKSLVNQKRPIFDTELVVNLGYDYEAGDLYSRAQASLFYPSWVEWGLLLAWYKHYRERENPLFRAVSDDLIAGPRIRGRAWNQVAYDLSLQWNLYRDFDGRFHIPGPRAHLSILTSF